ncbi:MAG: S41 family peptidase [Myxococcales bacterium]|nr:S41 family peptidase [Myxococcales bacterium]
MSSLRSCVAVVLLFAWGASAAPPSKEENTYRQLELFARVLSYVQNNYVEPVDEQQLMYGAIKGMLETLDPHTQFMPPDVFKEMKIDTSGEFGGLGIEIARRNDNIVVVSPIDDTPAQRAGIRPGDQILKIDDEPTRNMELARAIQKMRGPAGKKVLLTIMREGFTAAREFAIIRDHIRIASVESALYGGIGHVKVKNFQERTDQSLNKELQKLRAQNGGKELKGLVLDLRNNPGGLLDQAVAVSDRFLPGELTIVSTRGRNGTQVTEERSKDRDVERGYPMVVLVNAGSASASEIVAGALQDNQRAVILGTPTFGKGSVQTVIEMEDGSGLKLTIARYYTPSGRSIQEKGILPDYIVPETEGGVVQKPDQLREKDLKHHFRGEGEALDATAIKVSLPPSARPSRASEKVTDYQLKVALDYLANVPAPLEGKNTARAPK